MAITSGTGARVISASDGFMKSIAIAASRIVSRFWTMKISLYPRKKRTDWRSTVALDISWPTCCPSKKPSSSLWRCPYIRFLRSYSTLSETRPAMSRRDTDSRSRDARADDQTDKRQDCVAIAALDRVDDSPDEGGNRDRPHHREAGEYE